MNWLKSLDGKLFLSVMGVVFISEMGDKTQLTTMLLAGSKPMYVLWIALGSAIALICTSFLEVMIGSKIVAKYLNPRSIKFLSALAFLALGCLLVFGVIGNIKIE
ncbi:MAG: TMEM165/GDT1 family protein [Chitinophagales bacterium]